LHSKCSSVYQQYICNLISNSIKYRRDDLPLRIITAFTRFEGYSKISFIDNGKGVDTEKYGEKLVSLYKRFHLDKEGKGLGLYIVKTQVEML